LLNQDFWADWTILYELGVWQNFAMTSPETLYMKNVANKLSFRPVTHTSCFNIRFDRYGFLKSGFNTDLILDSLAYRCLVRFSGQKMGETCWGLNTKSEAHLLRFPTPIETHVSDADSHVHGHFVTATCGVSGLLKNRVIERIGAFGSVTDIGNITTF
jgi:hypothetical protein